VAGRLAPRIVGISEVPLLAHLDEFGAESDRLRWRVVVYPEAGAGALAGGQRGVETHADHLDDLLVLEHGHAGETDIREETADVDVDLILDQELLDLAAGDVGFRLVVGHHDFDRPAIDAALL